MPRAQHLLAERHVRDRDQEARDQRRPQDAEIGDEKTHWIAPPGACRWCRRRGRRGPSPRLCRRPRTAVRRPARGRARTASSPPSGRCRHSAGSARRRRGELRHELTEIAGARRHAGFRLDRGDFLQAEPVAEIGLVAVHDRRPADPLSGAAFASQRAIACGPARIEIAAALAVVGRAWRRRAAASLAVSAFRNHRDVVRIELDVRIARADGCRPSSDRAAKAPPAASTATPPRSNPASRAGCADCRIPARAPAASRSRAPHRFATTRSAVRARATRLGFASTRCTSCIAVVAT